MSVMCSRILLCLVLGPGTRDCLTVSTRMIIDHGNTRHMQLMNPSSVRYPGYFVHADNLDIC